MSPEDREKMDRAMAEASKELNEMLMDGNEPFEKSVEKLANWWKKWYMLAGHKRLGRVLLGEASNE